MSLLSKLTGITATSHSMRLERDTDAEGATTGISESAAIPNQNKRRVSDIMNTTITNPTKLNPNKLRSVSDPIGAAAEWREMDLRTKSICADSLVLYDTTLRDGAQRKGVSFSLEDKLKITHLLDEFGVTYIEGGWPGSNPKDFEYFQRVKTMGLKNAMMVAFGSTRKAGVTAEDDLNLRRLMEADTPAVALVGKASSRHVMKVLRTSLDENIAMIVESIRLAKRHGKEVIFDAEHFFDGFEEDHDYALSILIAAEAAGADWLVLCDTNGRMFPSRLEEIVDAAYSVISKPLGIHAHNDSELAVANSLSAVEAGAKMIQGTINGYGERCGNANLISLVPTL